MLNFDSRSEPGLLQDFNEPTAERKLLMKTLGKGHARAILICLLLALASASVASARKPAASSRESLVVGRWYGTDTVHSAVYHHLIDVRQDGTGYVGDGLAWFAMTQAQAEAIRSGKSTADLRTLDCATCVQLKYVVTLKGKILTFQCTAAKPLYQGWASINSKQYAEFAAHIQGQHVPENAFFDRIASLSMRMPALAEYHPLLFSGALAAPGLVGGRSKLRADMFVHGMASAGIITRETDDGSTVTISTVSPVPRSPSAGPPSLNPQADSRSGFFRFWKQGAFAKPLPLTLHRGRTYKLACLGSATYHYTCYLPHYYNPSHPTPVLLYMASHGNAKPLSTGMADKLGWIMVGLTEAQDGPWPRVCENRDAVLFDLHRRFNIARHGLYFAGFSGGSRASILAGVSYPDQCAGLYCIGAGTPYQDRMPILSIPIYFSAGETDINRGEVTTLYEKERARGRVTKLEIHSGGHFYGMASDHDAAISWLAKVSR